MFPLSPDSDFERYLLEPRVGEILDARLVLWLLLREFDGLPRKSDSLFFSSLSCLASRRAISWNSFGRFEYISTPCESVFAFAFSRNVSFSLKICL